MARTVSRADVSSFSAADLVIKDQNGSAFPAFGKPIVIICKEDQCPRIFSSPIVIVYTCRTSNAWDRDLALSATYFPHCGLTFAVMFGCTVSVEQQVIKRLERAALESCHPLLVPGILVELERSRHISIVEESIDELETRILELSSLSEQVESLSAQEQLARNEAKRSAWLDTTYLRNHLITWVAQLEKLSRCLDELSEHSSRRNTAERINIGGNIVLIESLGLEDRPLSRLTLSEEAFGSLKRTLFDTLPEKGIKGTQLQTHCSTDLSGVIKDTLLENRIEGTELQAHSSPDKSPNIPEDTLLEKEIKGTELQTHSSPDKSPDVPEDTPLEHKVLTTDSNTDLAQEQMKRIGKKIKARVLDVIDEYNDKIRDCTMRVDGMAMSTQWVVSLIPTPHLSITNPLCEKKAQGETSVEIATATGRDSRHMRSIALVTMIFLPGTFFAVRCVILFQDQLDWKSSHRLESH